MAPVYAGLCRAAARVYRDSRVLMCYIKDSFYRLLGGR